MTTLLNENLLKKGHLITHFPISEEIRELVQNEDWNNIDQAFQKLTSKEGELFRFLKSFHEFNSIEFIISIRDAQNEWEEDGIWHDDGSRLLAFSLSLTLDHELIKGGVLGIRKKGESLFHQISTPPFGEIIVFLTGAYEFEHKIHQVSAGKRVIIAGWCS